jgi:hypothetical protein
VLCSIVAEAYNLVRIAPSRLFMSQSIHVALDSDCSCSLHLAALGIGCDWSAMSGSRRFRQTTRLAGCWHVLTSQSISQSHTPLSLDLGIYPSIMPHNSCPVCLLVGLGSHPLDPCRCWCVHGLPSDGTSPPCVGQDTRLRHN